MTSDHPADHLTQRYGAGSGRGRKAFLAIGAVIVAGLIGWFVWAVWLHSHPKVGSSMDGWELQGQNAVKITVEVNIYDATAAPTCTVKAYAEDHATVGMQSFRPIAGRQTIILKTEREATSVDWIGCVAKGQQDPQ